MSVYIKGMEMPKSCAECPFFIRNRHDRGDDSLCLASGKEAECGCPLILVPDHGALIDRDDFFATCPELVDGYKHITDDLVVIPAEEGE